MTKAKYLQNEFCRLIGEKAKRFDGNPNELIKWLVERGLITPKTVERYMTVAIYRRKMKATATAKKPRGCRMLALHETINVVQVSEPTARHLTKNSAAWFDDDLF